MAGERLHDDPVWVDVSAFLADLEAAYPPNPEPRGRDGHLAALARETRRLRADRARAAPPARRPRLHLLAAWAVATLLAATAAVGIAGATGRGPLARAWHPVPAATEPAPSLEPSPGPTQKREPSSPGRANLGGTRAAAPAAGPARAHQPDGLAREAGAGKHAADKPGTGLPGVPANDPDRSANRPEKQGKGRPGVPGNGERGAAVRPADKPGKGQPGVPGNGEHGAAVRPADKPGKGQPGVPGNGEHGAAVRPADNPGKGQPGVPGNGRTQAGEG